MPNLVQGNYIGVDASGNLALGNRSYGVDLFSNGNIIGGDTAAAGNVIANTRPDVFGNAFGVGLELNSTHNTILSNSIYSNGSLGIRLPGPGLSKGPLPNDPQDADTSAQGYANEGQNYPVLDQVQSGGGVTTIDGHFNSLPSATFTLQFFSNDLVDPSGYGEGQSLLTQTTVTTDTNGDATFSLLVPQELAGAKFVTATATGPDGSTSEFSKAVGVAALPAADLTLKADASPGTVDIGADLTYALTVTNNGPANAGGVVVRDVLPPGATFVSGSNGATVDSNGVVSFSPVTINSNESATFTYTVRPTIAGTIADDASVSADTIDPVPADNTASHSVKVTAPAGTSILSFAGASFSVLENAGSATITVTRSNGLAPTTVDYAVTSGSATAGADFTAVSGTLSFAQDELSKTFTVPILDDFLIEGDETANLTLSNPGTGSVLGQPVQATLVIVDDDPNPPPAGSFRIGAAAFNVIEGAPFVTIPVERVGGSAGEARVRIKTVNGSATAGSDYGAVDYQLIFSNNDAVPKLINIPILDDAVYEPTESFNVQLLDPVTAAVTDPSTAVVTIKDNDPAPTPVDQQTVSFNAASYTAAENAPVASLVINRSDGNGTYAVTVRSVGGTAQPGVRYRPVNQSVTFLPGETSKIVDVPLINDNVYEGNQTVNFVIDVPQGGPKLGDPGQATLTILDDEQAPPPPPPMSGQIEFAQAGYSVDEAAGTATLTVQRVNGTQGQVTLYAIPDFGDAVAGVNYVHEAVPIVFQDGQSTATVQIRILNDGVMTGNLSVDVLLTPPSNGATLGDPGVAVLTIVDAQRDMVPPTVTDVSMVGPAAFPVGFAVTFSEAMDPARVVNPAAYAIVSAGRDGLFGTRDDSVLGIADIGYIPATHTAVFVTSTRPTPGITYRLAVDGQTSLAVTDEGGNALDGDGNGTAGGYFLADVSRSPLQQYVDDNGDAVTLFLQGGGTLDLVRGLDGSARSLRVVDPVPGRSLLAGTVRRTLRTGDGLTTIGQLYGADRFGVVRVALTTPPFIINQVVPAAVDALLGGSVAVGQSAARRR